MDLLHKTFISIGIYEHILIIFHFLMPFVRITIISKIMIPSMCKTRLWGWFEWTPKTFCSCTNLNRIGKYTINITAIETIYLFKEIQIIEKSSVIVDILRPFYKRNPIQSKCNSLEYGNRNIKKQNWNNYSINKWYWKNIADMSPFWRNKISI